MPDSTRATVILVDDDTVLLHLLHAILKPYYEVKPFASGSAALDYLAANPADLVLLDYNLPDLNGFEVLDRILAAEASRHLAFIFLTGTEDGDSEVAALERGAADYILKPIKPRTLLTRVRLQLELQRYRKRLESMVERRTEHLHQAYNRLRNREEITLSLLAKVTDLRDHGTGDHIWRTTEFVRVITEELLRNPRPGYELSPGKADDIIRSSKLHDIGKIATPDVILGKLGKLTDAEFAVVKLHPQHGAELLDEFIGLPGDDSFLRTARDIAVSHHEKWNGKGYPKGLHGENIPLSGRIVAIADVYDALISVRPYKQPLSHDDSARIIVADSGQHFDPYLVEMFRRRSEDFRLLSLSREKVSKTTSVRIKPTSRRDTTISRRDTAISRRETTIFRREPESTDQARA